MAPKAPRGHYEGRLERVHRAKRAAQVGDSLLPAPEVTCSVRSMTMSPLQPYPEPGGMHSSFLVALGRDEE